MPSPNQQHECDVGAGTPNIRFTASQRKSKRHFTSAFANMEGHSLVFVRLHQDANAHVQAKCHKKDIVE